MEHYADFKSTDPLHITSFRSDSIKRVAEIIQGQFNLIGMIDQIGIILKFLQLLGKLGASDIK